MNKAGKVVAALTAWLVTQQASAQNPMNAMDDGPPTGGEGPGWLIVVLVIGYVWLIWAVVSGPLQAWANESEWRAPLLLYGLPLALFVLYLLFG